MFVFGYIKSFLQKFGLFRKNGKILFLGLANAGKTSLLGRLKDGRFKQYDPTTGSNTEEVIIGNMKLKAFDLGGHEAVRKAWKSYYQKVDCIFYLVDSSNIENFSTSKEELNKILTCTELEKVPVAILANKIDLRNAVGEDELRESLGIPPIVSLMKDEVETLNNHPIKIFMCSLSKNLGYQESFNWVSNFIK